MFLKTLWNAPKTLRNSKVVSKIECLTLYTRQLSSYKISYWTSCTFKQYCFHAKECPLMSFGWLLHCDRPCKFLTNILLVKWELQNIWHMIYINKKIYISVQLYMYNVHYLIIRMFTHQIKFMSNFYIPLARNVQNKYRQCL